jgi:hypothetical protein
MVEDSIGNVFVTNSNNFSQIWKITPSGVLTVFASQPGITQWMGINSNDDLYVVLTNGSVRKISNTGAVTYLYGIGADLSAVGGVVADSSNNIFFIYRKTNNDSVIMKITPSGTVSQFVSLNNISGIPLLLIDSSNNLYFINQFLQQVGKITPLGVISYYGSGVGVNSGPALNQLVSIQMVIDSSGNIFNTDWGAQRVYKTTPLGVTTFYSLSSRPFSLSIDSNDNLYASMYDNTITKITPSGVITTLGVTGGFPYGTLVNSLGDTLYIANNQGGTVTTLPI